MPSMPGTASEKDASGPGPSDRPSTAGRGRLRISSFQLLRTAAGSSGLFGLHNSTRQSPTSPFKSSDTMTLPRCLLRHRHFDRRRSWHPSHEAQTAPFTPECVHASQTPRACRLHTDTAGHGWMRDMLRKGTFDGTQLPMPQPRIPVVVIAAKQKRLVVEKGHG